MGKRVSIKVLRKYMDEELAGEYLTGGVQPCDFFDVGQSFVLTALEE